MALRFQSTPPVCNCLQNFGNLASLDLSSSQVYFRTDHRCYIDQKKFDYLCKCKSAISNVCNALKGHCLEAMKIVHHHANGIFDWLISEHQSVNPSREAISTLSGKYKRFTFVHHVVVVIENNITVRLLCQCTFLHISRCTGWTNVNLLYLYRNYFSRRSSALGPRNEKVKTAIGMVMHDFHSLKTMIFLCVSDIAYFRRAVKVCTISFERPVNYLCDAWHVFPPKYEVWTHFNRP